MPVHLYGQLCEMDKINAIAKKHNLKINKILQRPIEDLVKYHKENAK